MRVLKRIRRWWRERLRLRRERRFLNRLAARPYRER